MDGNGDGSVQPRMVLMIALMPNGVINCNIPDDELLGRGLLDKLRASMDDHYRAKAQGPSRVVLPSAAGLPMFRGGAPI